MDCSNFSFSQTGSPECRFVSKTFPLHNPGKSNSPKGLDKVRAVSTIIFHLSFSTLLEEAPKAHKSRFTKSLGMKPMNKRNRWKKSVVETRTKKRAPLPKNLGFVSIEDTEGRDNGKLSEDNLRIDLVTKKVLAPGEHRYLRRQLELDAIEDSFNKKREEAIKRDLEALQPKKPRKAMECRINKKKKRVLKLKRAQKAKQRDIQRSRERYLKYQDTHEQFNDTATIIPKKIL